jgi:hypothetical protein
VKPHEVELSVVQFDKERRCLVEGDGRGQRMVAVLRNYESDEWEAFLCGSRAMALALMAVLQWDDASRADPSAGVKHPREQVYDALVKARVLP